MSHRPLTPDHCRLYTTAYDLVTNQFVNVAYKRHSSTGIVTYKLYDQDGNFIAEREDTYLCRFCY